VTTFAGSARERGASDGTSAAARGQLAIVDRAENVLLTVR